MTPLANAPPRTLTSGSTISLTSSTPTWWRCVAVCRTWVPRLLPCRMPLCRQRIPTPFSRTCFSKTSASSGIRNCRIGSTAVGEQFDNAINPFFAQGDFCGLICNGTDGTAADPTGGNGGFFFGDGGTGFDAADDPVWPAVTAGPREDGATAVTAEPAAWVPPAAMARRWRDVGNGGDGVRAGTASSTTGTPISPSILPRAPAETAETPATTRTPSVSRQLVTAVTGARRCWH